MMARAWCTPREVEEAVKDRCRPCQARPSDCKHAGIGRCRCAGLYGKGQIPEITRVSAAIFAIAGPMEEFQLGNRAVVPQNTRYQKVIRGTK